jgi:hypothetical protein
MKKSLILLLVVLMIYSLAACYGEVNDESTEPSQTESETVAPHGTSIPPEESRTNDEESTSAEALENSQLDEAYSELERLNELLGSLDDVSEGDLEIPVS